MDANSPLLFFDSGVGGLSVLEPTRKLLPNAPIVYVADNAGYPYGKRSEAEIASRVPALLGRLVERFHPRLAVIACNTASTIALDHVRSALDLPVVGTVPAIKPAAEMSKTRAIGVLGTEATVRQPYVDNLAAEFAAVSVRRSRIRQLAEDGDSTAKRLLPILEDAGALDRYIAACQVGITLGSLILGAYGQIAFGPGLAALLGEQTGLDPVAAYATLESVNDVPAVPVVKNRTHHIALVPSTGDVPQLPAELRGMLRYAPEILDLAPAPALVW